ncbi:helix-turn-helix domain-containing protein [Sunxiuqinia elliptica]|uniref:Putative Tic20 family protein n=1 Tax=Sunxiuqinia elliptica TaxID=655355 RepID=A0A4R6GYD3_9BACT|nr:helix-turn-helix domain-containing protein [Sunxiuqinia elliptica]TDN99854.1 putative Tic20 family protein [Sunxiuqinia elliptica]TDO57046.1 putative Tic20 family protein [Sunxiuqinia elliptica]
MDNQNLAIKIKNLRNRKGFTQEQLSEESKLSLRTIQRIEKGESIPRGDTLVKLTQALGVTPDDLLEWEIPEDNGYLQLLNWSSLSFIFNPILGIVLPLVMWILKREKVKSVDDSGMKIINFQITWTLTFYLTITILSMMLDGEFYIPFRFSIQNSISALIANFSIATVIVFSLYSFNLAMILLNVRKSQKRLENKYLPAIPFLR